ncbi:MAG: SHOCT domain-containing protein [Deltaproteobacteria bacterium]
MKGVKALTVMVMTVAALGLTACGGGGAKVQSQQSSYSTTLGQELEDLQDSYKKGIITKEQYEAAKKKLIEQRTEEK